MNIEFYSVERDFELVRLKGIVNGKMTWAELPLEDFDELIEDILLSDASGDINGNITLYGDARPWSAMELLFEEVTLRSMEQNEQPEEN